MSSASDWSTDFESGLLDNFDFTITDAIFAPDAKYNDGNTILLQLNGTTDDDDNPETHVWYPVGKGWNSEDGGATIVHESGKERNFNRSSMISKLVSRCVDDLEIGAILRERGPATQADVWVGLQFHMKAEDVDFGSMGAKSKLLPASFIGVVGESKKGAKKSVKASKTPVSQAESEATGELTAAEKIAAAKKKQAATKSGPTLKDKVIAIFEAADDFSTAQDEALALDGVTEDGNLLDSILDDTGLWAEVKAA